MNADGLIASFPDGAAAPRYFVAVAEEGHFGRAAGRLHMAQPQLSQQIRQLEAELGVRVFARTTRTVELTPAGELLLARARRILADVDTASVDVQRAERGEIGRLSVGFTDRPPTSCCRRSPPPCGPVCPTSSSTSTARCLRPVR
jgi:DNA-binding transcriptional LysR family regulator